MAEVERLRLSILVVLGELIIDALRTDTKERMVLDHLRTHGQICQAGIVRRQTGIETHSHTAVYERRRRETHDERRNQHGHQNSPRKSYRDERKSRRGSQPGSARVAEYDRNADHGNEGNPFPAKEHDCGYSRAPHENLNTTEGHPVSQRPCNSVQKCWVIADASRSEKRRLGESELDDRNNCRYNGGNDQQLVCVPGPSLSRDECRSQQSHREEDNFLDRVPSNPRVRRKGEREKSCRHQRRQRKEIGRPAKRNRTFQDPQQNRGPQQNLHSDNRYEVCCCTRRSEPEDRLFAATPHRSRILSETERLPGFPSTARCRINLAVPLSRRSRAGVPRAQSVRLRLERAVPDAPMSGDAFQ